MGNKKLSCMLKSDLHNYSNKSITVKIPLCVNPLLSDPQLLTFLYPMSPMLVCSLCAAHIMANCRLSRNSIIYSSSDHVKDMISGSRALLYINHNLLCFPHNPVSTLRLNHGGRKWRENPLESSLPVWPVNPSSKGPQTFCPEPH